MEPILSSPPIFIVGPGRSGTTLLRSLLSAHSRIAVTPETHFLKVAEQHGGLRRGAPADFEAFWTGYIKTPRFKDLGVSPERCRDLIEKQGEPTMRNIFRALLAAYGERCGKARVGEKTPGHVRFMPDLLECFPEARIIILQRDPRAVVASQIKTPWTRSRISSCSVRNGVVVNSRMHQVGYYASNWRDIYRKLVPPVSADSRVTLVSYERLVRSPEPVLRELCAFIGETFEPKMLTERTSETVPQPVAADEMSSQWREWRVVHNRKTLAPVSTQSVDAWRSELTPLELALIEGRCGHGMPAAGYEPVLSPLRRSGGRLGVPVIDALERVEAYARDRLRRRIGRWRGQAAG